jgi:hypothetical protein
MRSRELLQAMFWTGVIWWLAAGKASASPLLQVLVAIGQWAIALALVYWAARSTKRALVDLHRTWRLLGGAASLRGLWLMTKLVYRSPFRYIWYAPGLSFVFPLGIAAMIHFYGSWSLAKIVILTALGFLCGVFIPMVKLAPPIVLWLSSSGYESFRVMKNLMKIVPNGVKTLIDQTSPDVLANYDAHYTAPLQSAAWASPLLLRPGAPHFESVRTRTHLWVRTVLDLLDFSPIVVVDLRFLTPAVLQEIDWVTAPSYAYKALFLVPDGSVVPPEGSDVGKDVLVVNEKILYDVVRRMVREPGSLPRRGDDRWIAEVRDMIDRTKKALTAVLDPTSPEEELERSIRDWDGGQSPEGQTGERARVSSSVDAVLALIARRAPGSSLRLDVFIHGAAAASIGVLDPGGSFRVAESTPDENLSPPRALLCALLRSELGLWKQSE